MRLVYKTRYYYTFQRIVKKVLQIELIVFDVYHTFWKNNEFHELIFCF